MGGVLLNWFAGNPSDLTRRCFLGSAAAPALGTLASQAGAGAATRLGLVVWNDAGLGVGVGWGAAVC